MIDSLSDEDFQRLCQHVYNRARSHGLSRRSAQARVRRIQDARLGRKIWPDMKAQRPELFYSRFKPNRIMDSVWPGRSSKSWRHPVARKEAEYLQLRQFSLVDDPVGTMRQLKRLIEMESSIRVARVDFKDERVLDIAPYLIWGYMARDMCPFMLGGKIERPVSKVLEAVELSKFMGIRFLNQPDDTDVWAFGLRHRSGADADPANSFAASIVADKFVETVNEWLEMLPDAMELTRAGARDLNKIITEALDNAERYGELSAASGKDGGDWYITGFMARRPLESPDQDGREAWYDCHIAMVNLGDTIAETIAATTDPKISDALRRYTAKHSGALFRGGCSAETLATVFAMQDGVSARPGPTGTGGKGMMDLVQFTNSIGNTTDPAHQPVMTVISGKSCVQFKEIYRCFRRPTSGRPHRQQYFNTTGGFDDPPDKDYVFDLDIRFPGTVIAIRFSLDPKVMESKTGD